VGRLGRVEVQRAGGDVDGDDPVRVRRMRLRVILEAD
jgi:hypothetical protein